MIEYSKISKLKTDSTSTINSSTYRPLADSSHHLSVCIFDKYNDVHRYDSSDELLKILMQNEVIGVL